MGFKPRVRPFGDKSLTGKQRGLSNGVNLYAGPLHPYDLLKSIVQLSNSSLPAMRNWIKCFIHLRSFSIRPDVFFLEAGENRQGWFSLPCGLGEKTLMGRERVILPEENASPEEERAFPPDLCLSSLV